MASPPTTLYSILNLTPRATKKEIKVAYRRETRLAHPEQNPENVVKANAKFLQLQDAYETLSDDHERKEYDMATFCVSRIVLKKVAASVGTVSPPQSPTHLKTPPASPRPGLPAS